VATKTKGGGLGEGRTDIDDRPSSCWWIRCKIKPIHYKVFGGVRRWVEPKRW